MNQLKVQILDHDMLFVVGLGQFFVRITSVL